jgi:hypothetical protein
MSRTIHFLGLQILAAGGLLGTSLLVPATADAQTGGTERALLNYTVATSYVADPVAFWAPAPALARNGTDEGARALLGRADSDPTSTPYQEPTSAASQVNVRPVNGERALLGKWTEQ